MEQLETRLDDMATVYHRREQDFYQGGTMAVSKILEAYTCIENIAPSMYVSGKIPVAEELQRIASILGECLGKGPAPHVGVLTNQRIQKE